VQPLQKQENGRRRSRTLFLFFLTAVIVFFVAVPVYGIIRDMGMGETIFVLDSSIDISTNPSGNSPSLFDRIHNFLFPDKDVSVPVIKVIDLEGRVVYTDGSPYTGGQIKLQSEPRYTTTNDNGSFSFHDVEEGHHTIFVLDDNGKTLAQAEILIERVTDQSETTVERLPDGTYVFKVSFNVKLLEIVLTLKRGDDAVTASGIEDILIGSEEDNEPSNPPNPTGPPGVSASPEPSSSPGTTPSDNGGNGGGGGGGGGQPGNQFDFSVHDPKIYYGTDHTASINIFGDTKRIAPGMKGSYTFTVDNSKNNNQTNYFVNFVAYDSLPEDSKIPMRFKLKADNNYIVGSDEIWHSLDELNHSSTLKAKTAVTYTLYWYWPESANDNKYAKYADYTYSLAIKVTAEGK
jgi:hypothetical protein